MNNEVEINEICKKESRLEALREWLAALFFVAAAVTFAVIFRTLSAPEMDSQTAGKIILGTLIAFALIFYAWYPLDKYYLPKKLDYLSEQKKILF